MTIAQMVAEEHYTFAKIISRRYCLKIGFDMTEDLEAEGLVGLVKATNSYMPGKLSFKSWAAFNIRSEIRSSIKNNFRTKKGQARMGAITISIGDIDALYESSSSIESKFCNKSQLRKLMGSIPERWKEVIILHFVYGYNLREIGVMKGYTKANASRIKIAAVRKMRSALKEL